MPLQISRNDIRNITADAIVDPTDHFLSGSGSADHIIHQMAGEQLEKELSQYGYLESGEALITAAYQCENCSYIIHTCGPVYIDGNHNEAETLASCYEQCLKIAKEKGLGSIVFPLIASGNFSFPKGQALKIATDTITSFLLENEMDVSLLVYDRESFDSASKLYSDIRNYLDRYLYPREPRSSAVGYHSSKKKKSSSMEDSGISFSGSFEMADAEKSSYVPMPQQMDSYRFEPDESFSECLIRMIDERGLKDPEVYKKANIDRKLFNHIINDKYYRPKKETAVALAIGMKLNMKDTATLLERAGYVLSKAIKFDLIIRYCIEHRIYNIFEINEILFAEDQKTLGC